MSRPVIALLTDFGLSGHYVGTMKGVMLGICPEVSLVDISHDIPAHDRLAGALELAAACRYFPDGTVFLVVVDPGVGSARRAIAARAGGYRFVGPDNGVLSIALDRIGGLTQIVELADPRYRRPTVSRTFEGRDRFAPAAAYLASGIDLAALGPAAGAIEPLAVPPPQCNSEVIDGEVLLIDRFGNLITNIDRGLVDPLTARGALTIRICGRALTAIVSTYDEAPAGAVCALFGSSDALEIAVNRGSAAAALGAARGTPVRIETAAGRRA